MTIPEQLKIIEKKLDAVLEKRGLVFECPNCSTSVDLLDLDLGKATEVQCNSCNKSVTIIAMMSDDYYQLLGRAVKREESGKDA